MIQSLHLRCGATLVAAALSFSSATSFAEEVRDAASAPQQRPIAVIAHRGGALLRPENTMPAFRHAAEIRAASLAFDMDMTADNRVVVYHDALINPDFCKQPERPRAMAAPVRELPLAAIPNLDCGSAPSPHKDKQ